MDKALCVCFGERNKGRVILFGSAKKVACAERRVWGGGARLCLAQVCVVLARGTVNNQSE